MTFPGVGSFQIQGHPCGSSRHGREKDAVDDEDDGGLDTPLYVDYQPDPFGARHDEFWNLAIPVDPASY